jgi:hypothetical protein
LTLDDLESVFITISYINVQKSTDFKPQEMKERILIERMKERKQEKEKEKERKKRERKKEKSRQTAG